MTTDLLGNPITVESEALASAVNDFVGGLISYETRAVNVLGAAEAAPECCIANAYAAMLYMFSEAPRAADRAKPYLDRAEAAAGRATPRERQNLAMVRAWAENDIPRVLSVGSRINASHPRDLIVLKLRHYHQFNTGDFVGMLRAAEGVVAQNEDIAQMHGMIAFAYEQCHLIDEAEIAARRSLSMKANEPWAQHALAHVMLTEGRIDEGARFMEGVSSGWSGLNSFMATHQWWHLALFYISQGRFNRALQLYDEGVWGADKSYSQDQVGAVSLLARLEIAGVDVGDRWNDLGDHLASRVEDVVLPFLTMQYLYGLARAGRPETARLLRVVRQHAEDAPEHERAAWADVALPACDGLTAYAGKRFDVAVEKLGEALPRMAETGGSHAQRDLFEQIWIDALIKDERYAAAQNALELRRRYDPDGIPVNAALAQVYQKLDLAPLAARAAARADATRLKFR